MTAWFDSIVQTCADALGMDRSLPTTPATCKLAKLLGDEAPNAIETRLIQLSKAGTLKLSDKGSSRVFEGQSLHDEIAQLVPHLNRHQCQQVTRRMQAATDTTTTWIVLATPSPNKFVVLVCAPSYEQGKAVDLATHAGHMVCLK
jgi:hypothetical protein